MPQERGGAQGWLRVCCNDGGDPCREGRCANLLAMLACCPWRWASELWWLGCWPTHSLTVHCVQGARFWVLSFAFRVAALTGPFTL